MKQLRTLMIRFEEFVNAIQGAILAANDKLMEKNQDLLELFFERIDPEGSLSPRYVTVQYPEQTAGGIVTADVQVPLITLVPLSMTHISELKLLADLEIEVDEDERLVVGFPSRESPSPRIGRRRARSDAGEEHGNTAVASIEITLTPHAGPEGLRRLVEGYERILRAQIPN